MEIGAIDQEPELGAFRAHLHTLDRSEDTVDAYMRDLRAFAEWLSGEEGRPTPVAEAVPLEGALPGQDLRYKALACSPGTAPRRRSHVDSPELLDTQAAAA